MGLLAACTGGPTAPAPVPTAALLQPSSAVRLPTATLLRYPTLPPEWTQKPAPPPTFTRTPRPTRTPTVTSTPTLTSTSTVTPTVTLKPTVTHAATATPGSSTVVTTAATPVPGATAAPTTGGMPPVSPGSFELGGQVNGIIASTSRMRSAGMAWVKVQERWSPGATAGNGKIQEAHNQGFKILLSVLGDPSTISGGANFDAYAAYVGELARLGADAIEIWNEMNIDREWPAGQINPVTYTDLLRRAYTQIKAKNASTLVISGALAPTGAEGAFGADHVWNDDRYVAGLASAGAASYLDCIGLHYNEGILSPTRNSGDSRSAYYTRYYAGMVSTYYNAFGGARKLCFTELGYLTPEGYGTLPANFAWAANTTVAQQAQWLGEAASLSRAGGVVRLMVVFNVDLTVWGDDPQAGYAILRADGTCPACEALRAVTGGR
jgi:hypothetical protein